MLVAAERLIVNSLASAFVQVVAELTTHHVVGTHRRHLVALNLIAIREAYLRTVVAGKGTVAVDSLGSYYSAVKAIHYLGTVAEPAADGTTLALTHDVASVVAVDDAHISLAEVVHTKDTSTVGTRSAHVDRSLVTAVLDGQHGLADGCTGDTCRVACGVDFARLVDHHVLDGSTADDAEETLVAAVGFDDHVLNAIAVAIESTCVRTLHVLPVALAIFLAEACADAFEADTLQVDVACKVDDDVRSNLTGIDAVGKSLQLTAVANHASTAHLADVVDILVVGTLRFALGVRIGDVATSRTVAVHRTDGIDHQVIGEGYRIVIATQRLAPSIGIATLVEAIAQLTRLHHCHGHHLGGILPKFSDVVGIEAVHHAVHVTGNHGGVATQAQQRRCHIAVLNECLHTTVGIADDGGTTLAVGGIHRTHKGAVVERRTLVTDGEESTVGGVAWEAARDVHGHNDVLVGTSAAADKAQTADEALGALNGTVDDQIADGRIADHLEQCNAIVRNVVVDSNLMTLSVEDALERTAFVTLVGREGIATNHHVFLRVVAEVDVGTQTGVHLLVTFVHDSGKPVQVGRSGQRVEAIGQRQIIHVDIATARADAIDEGVRVAVRLVTVRIHLVATLRCAVAVQVAHGIDDSMR